MPVKKIIVAAALVMSLAVIGCNDNKATPSPTAPAQAVESMAAEAVASTAAEVEAVESMAADVQGAVESMAADALASPAA